MTASLQVIKDFSRAALHHKCPAICISFSSLLQLFHCAARSSVGSQSSNLSSGSLLVYASTGGALPQCPQLTVLASDSMLVLINYSIFRICNCIWCSGHFSTPKCLQCSYLSILKVLSNWLHFCVQNCFAFTICNFLSTLTSCISSHAASFC